MSIKLTQFIIGNHGGKTDCQIIIPREEDGRDKIGRIFFISENAKNSNNQKMGVFFKQEIKKYYGSQIPLNTEIDEIKIENIFENFLYNFNNNIHNFIRREKLTIDLNKFLNRLNLLIGLIYYNINDDKHYLYFSQIGKLDSLLIHPINKSRFDILQIKEAKKDNPNQFKIFSNIINGKIKSKSALIFCTNNILDYISLDKIKIISENNAAENISTEIKNLLLEVNGGRMFAGIIIKIEKSIIAEEKSSYDAVRPAIKQLNIVDNSIKETKKPVENSTPPTISVSRDKPEIALKMNEKKTELLQKIKKFQNRLKNLPRLKTVLLIAIIIFIALFAQGTFYLKNKKAAKEDNQYYKELQLEIEEKINRLEANLIYNDNDKMAVLIELENLIKKLPENSQEQKTKLVEIQQQIKNLDFKARMITEIKEHESLANFNKLTESPIIKIISAKETIYALALDNNFFALDLKNSSVKKIDHIKLNIPTALSQANIENSIIVLHQENAFSRLQIEKNKFEPLLVEFPESNANISAICDYGKRMYAVDIANSQIYKYSYTGDEFSAVQKWLKNDSVNLNKAISIAVDGSIYVLNSDKTIFNFFKGEKQEFQFENNEILISANKIWTDADSNYLYILDAEGKKITVLNKKGELIIQYYSDEFNNLKDFIVNETDKKIHLLSNNKIFKINITHI
ncbi:hypothetical protein KAS41_03390 [Candidatus Parcubacteria bacterium]|nr:hypothetical protein [Candidatus Parcubacteria bacterium]